MSLRVISFDLDETLCLSEKTDREFNAAVFDRAGREPLFTVEQLRSVDSEEIAPSTNLPEFYTNLYRAAARKFDLGITPEASLLEELGRYAGEVSAETGITFRDGAPTALEYARERYAVALITNGRRDTQTAKLEELGIADAFDQTVFCHPETGDTAKPAPEPFERVIRAFDADPDACVHVGDSHPVDIVGAHRAGFHSVWTPVERPHEDIPTDPDPPPSYRINTLGELPRVLRALESG